MGVQGKDFKRELLGDKFKPSKGLRQANLSPRTKALLEEVALSEQVISLPLLKLSIPARPSLLASLIPARIVSRIECGCKGCPLPKMSKKQA